MTELRKRSEMRRDIARLNKSAPGIDADGLVLRLRAALQYAQIGRAAGGERLAAAALSALTLVLEKGHATPSELITGFNAYAASRSVERTLSELFRADAPERRRTAYRTGYDGELLTREQAVRLRLVRFFETATSDLARLAASAYQMMTRQNGQAYLGWTRRLPIFLCDLGNPRHRLAAINLSEVALGELIVVTPRMTDDVRRIMVRHEKRCLTVEDPAGLFAAVIGNYGSPLLLERRLGGWTITFPLGRVEKAVLTDRKLPLWARSLAAAPDPIARKAGEPESAPESTSAASGARA